MAEGALATVFHVERQGAPAGALKLYLPSAPLRRVERETLSQNLLKHPNVARLLDHGETPDGEVYLVTELVSGPSLRQLIARHPLGLSWQLAVEIATQAACGLDAIHQKGLVHRDLKPENIMLVQTATDEPLRVVLLDLGHALVLDRARLTRSGLVWGSAPYMSPEQTAGQNLDPRSDLYALGIVLYEMLTGRRPFEARAAVDVMQMHWNHVPDAPSTRVEVPAAVSDLCMWLLAKQPDLRPNSARIVHAALQGQLAGNRSKNLSALLADHAIHSMEQL
jgi:serine/threonine protein kinase